MDCFRIKPLTLSWSNKIINSWLFPWTGTVYIYLNSHAINYTLCLYVLTYKKCIKSIFSSLLDLIRGLPSDILPAVANFGPLNPAPPADDPFQLPYPTPPPGTAVGQLPPAVPPVSIQDILAHIDSFQYRPPSDQQLPPPNDISPAPPLSYPAPPTEKHPNVVAIPPQKRPPALIQPVKRPTKDPPLQYPKSPPAYQPAPAPHYNQVDPPAYVQADPPAYAPVVPPSHQPIGPPAYVPADPPAYAPVVPPSYQPAAPPAYSPPTEMPYIPPSTTASPYDVEEHKSTTYAPSPPAYTPTPQVSYQPPPQQQQTYEQQPQHQQPQHPQGDQIM